MLPYGAEEKKTAADKGKPKQQLEIEEKTALKSISFYLLLIFMIAITGVGVFVQHIPTYGQLLGYSAPVSYTHLDVYKRQYLYSGRGGYRARGYIFGFLWYGTYRLRTL